jgi:hypothetical protein
MSPKYIMHDEERQTKAGDLYPDRPIFILVMSKIEGIPLYIPTFHRYPPLILTPRDMETIRKQCLETLEYATILHPIIKLDGQ